MQDLAKIARLVVDRQNCTQHRRDSQCRELRVLAPFDLCLSNSMDDVCHDSVSCLGEQFCNSNKKCVPKGLNGAKCESYKQCSQNGAQRTCVNGVCQFHGAGPGKPCSGNNCIPDYYCDMKSKTCQKITGKS
ncbi:hypothetical protein BC940DRAFT_322791 [Gongronella butleri]|nr:hypothetical protein BC940DRAFT_322791 [Gongronella butleri]